MEKLKTEKTRIAKATADQDNFNKTVERLEARMRPRDQGIVQVTFVKYILGTSALEAQFIEKEKLQTDLVSQLKEGKVISVDKEGERLVSCDASQKLWGDFRIHKNDYSTLVEEKVITKVGTGIKNCHAVGQVIPINSRGLEGDLGKVKITGLKLMSFETFKTNFSFIKGENPQVKFNEIVERLEKQLSDKEDKVVAITYAEFLGAE